MHSSSIRFRSRLVLGVLLAAAIGWATVGTLAAHQERAAMAAMNDASSLLRNHMEADMQHDAIRGEVMSIIAAQINPAIDAQEAAKSLTERIADFRERLARDVAFKGSPKVHTAALAVNGDADAYLAVAARIGAEAAARKPVTAADTEVFTDKFERLENGMARISDAVEANVLETRLVAEQELALSGWITLACLFALVSIILFVMRVFGGVILNPLRDMGEELSALAAGRYATRLAHVDRPDEIGALSRSIGNLRDQLREGECWTAHKNMSLTRSADGATDQSDQCISGSFRRDAWAWLIGPATAVHLSSCDAGQADTRTFGAPDRPIAVPDPGWCAGKRRALRRNHCASSKD